MGILFDIVGACLVAWEVVHQYKGKRHIVPMGYTFGDYVRPQNVEETKEYQRWEKNKYSKMKCGLWCLIIGFSMQLVSNWVNYWIGCVV
jgi:hypothetical protein